MRAASASKAAADIIEILKDCRATSIEEIARIDSVVVWKVMYVLDPDLEFTSLDDLERSIKSRCQIRAVTLMETSEGRRELEVEWI